VVIENFVFDAILSDMLCRMIIGLLDFSWAIAKLLLPSVNARAIPANPANIVLFVVLVMILAPNFIIQNILR
jgi:hypothetical protein